MPFGGEDALICLGLVCLKYCRSGGMAFAHEHGHRLLALGSNMAIMAPSGATLETAGLQGKSRRGPGAVPFGGSNGLVCLLLGAPYRGRPAFFSSALR
jgi:hypothetical protein